MKSHRFAQNVQWNRSRLNPPLVSFVFHWKKEFVDAIKTKSRHKTNIKPTTRHSVDPANLSFIDYNCSLQTLQTLQTGDAHIHRNKTKSNCGILESIWKAFRALSHLALRQDHFDENKMNTILNRFAIRNTKVGGKEKKSANRRENFAKRLTSSS